MSQEPCDRSAVPTVDTTWLQAQIDRLATFTDSEPPSVTRVLWTPTDLAARRYLRGLVEETGFTWREDAIGNLFVRWEGADPTLAAVATGSHVDAIPNAGRYDGVVGSLGGLEALRALRASGFRPLRSLELIVFTAEEPTRFGLGCLGSRLLSGALSPAAARNLRDSSGMTLEAARAAAGGGGRLEDVPLTPGCYHAFVELHIEQGPELEAQHIPIGIVTAIAAPAALRVVFWAEGGHAGTVLMDRRHDPLLAAAEVILEVERTARGRGRADMVATTGMVEVFPNAINSIPRRVTLGIDLRDTDQPARDHAVARLQARASAAATRRSVTCEFTQLSADPPAATDPGIRAAIASAAGRLGLPCMELVSRAYHDSLFMARLCPMGMIFIPCRGGISHHPAEYASPDDIARGVQVLALTLAQLAAT